MATDLRARLRRGGVATGTWCFLSAEADIARVLLSGGIDFAYLDVLNGGWSHTEVGAWCEAVADTGATPIVRAENHSTIYDCLNAGAGGVLVPDVRNATQVRDLVDLVRRAPLGSRQDPPRWVSVDRVGPDPLLCVQLERVESCEQMDEILAVPGIDIAVIGRRDLAVDLARNGQASGTKAVDRWARELIAAASRHGVVPGLMQPNQRAARRWAALGMRWLPINSDISILREASGRLRAAQAALRDDVERTQTI